MGNQDVIDAVGGICQIRGAVFNYSIRDHIIICADDNKGVGGPAGWRFKLKAKSTCAANLYVCDLCHINRVADVKHTQGSGAKIIDDIAVAAVVAKGKCVSDCGKALRVSGLDIVHDQPVHGGVTG